MKQVLKFRRHVWLVPILLGIVFIAAGAYMVTQGQSAKSDVRDALATEQVTTSQDASIPNAPVVDAATAQAQADAILHHSLALENGKTYSQMTRDDPNRNTYLQGVSLRTALNLAVMGFKVSDLVVGIGAFIIVMGLTNIFVLSPALYWLRVQEDGKAPATVRATTQVIAGSHS